MARERRRPMSPQQAIGRAATRRASRAPGSSADRIRALEGRYGRAGARQRLGVSERTMRRYRAGGSPSRRNADRIERETRMSSRRESRMRNRGAFVRLAGKVGGGTPGARRKNTRYRTIGDEGFESIRLSGEDMAGILDRWHAGDDAGAMEALQDAIRETPWGADFGSFEVDDLTMLEFLRDDPNG